MLLSPRSLLALSGGIAALLAAGCGKEAVTRTAAASSSQKQPVEVVAVERRDLIEALSLVGSLAANETAQLRAEIAGQVRSVEFNEGEHVAKGHVLLKIDDAELRAQLAQAEASFRLAELNLKRSADLTQARSMSQAEADRISSEHSSAEAALSLLQVRLSKMEIKAPFEGVVGARTVSPGDYVTAASSITTLDDLSRLKIDFQVPERFASKVRPGTVFTVRAQTPTGETSAEGEVYFISSVIDRNTRSTQVKGYIGGSLAGLKPGMFANIDLVLDVRKGAMTVPEGAILTTPSGTQIIVVRGSGDDRTADFIPVQTGLRAKGYVEIKPLRGELAEGQQVVASGVGSLILFPGAKLEPRPVRPVEERNSD
jgi:membrane fusion protein (multidrug efflux system)